MIRCPRINQTQQTNQHKRHPNILPNPPHPARQRLIKSSPPRSILPREIQQRHGQRAKEHSKLDPMDECPFVREEGLAFVERCLCEGLLFLFLLFVALSSVDVPFPVRGLVVVVVAACLAKDAVAWGVGGCGGGG